MEGCKMTVKMGFIGTGGIAQGHMDRLASIEGVQNVAFCDVQMERAQKAAEKFGGRAYDSFEKMLAEEELNAVMIATPPFAHGDIEVACCEKGLHMLIEKPIAIDTKMAKPILKCIECSGVITAVAYKYRWDDHVIRAKEMLKDRIIGLVFGNFWGGLPGAPWWRVQEQSGGQMVEQTTHIVDMARYLAGEIVTVQAFETHQIMHQRVENCNVADAAVANLIFANGAVGTISNTCMVTGWGQSSCRVMAEGFTCSVMGSNLTWNSKDDNGEYAKQVDGYMGEDAAFIHAVKTGDRSGIHSDYADAFKTLAVTVAVNESGQNGGAIVHVGDVM
jgi:myo-inositol 2-dehydrogenase/D-chiro-inositol 1-dehydrogenase